MFRRSLRLPFNLAGIPLHLDVSFLFVLPLMVWAAAQYLTTLVRLPMLGLDPHAFTGLTPLLLGLVSALGLFTSIVLHELGHSLTARWYGVRVRRITLWFLGGVAELEEMPRQRGAEAVVGIAGPIVSFVLAALFGGLTLLVPHAVQSVWLVCFYLAVVNLTLGLFNLLPALPMDGGRILRSLLALRMPHARATLIAGNVAKVIAVALALWGVFHNPWMILLAFFIFRSVKSEARHDVAVDVLGGLHVADLMARDVTSVPASVSVGELARYVMAHHRQSFPVVDDRGRLIGTIGIEQMHDAHPDTPVWQAMSADVLTIPEAASALDAYKLMGLNDAPRLVVTGADGQVIGLLSRSDLARAIQVRLMGFQVVPADNSVTAGGGPTPVTVQRVAPTPFTPYPPQPPVGYTRSQWSSES